MIIFILFLTVIFFVALAAALFAFAIARVISLACRHGNQKRAQTETQKRIAHERELYERLIQMEREKIVAQTEYALLVNQIQAPEQMQVVSKEEAEDDVLSAGEIDG